LEALDRQAVAARAKIFLALASLGWFFYIVYRTAFQEGFTLLAGIMTVGFWLVLFSRGKRRGLRRSAAGLLLVALVFGGRVFIIFADRIQETKSAYARALIEGTGDALAHYETASRSLPNCPWSCMTAELEKYGLWNPTVEYVDHDRPVTEYVPHIPHRDPWGCRYAFDIRGERAFSLTSSGPDRRFGTDDDIRVDRTGKEAAPASDSGLDGAGIQAS
jgi:hypothetical protein